ncbi:YfhO family protein [Vagococcus entomophilus]|uniref:Copper ABC transporter permease n=1 Tax=Vagococcus entomophilus TaxID=1160095 RepID=A0A430AIG5_9ENTE|nr:YfhO family protein [Vagococcus entomophilus]RSU07880.1 hypothetical protein CBF30_01175 [Vagococcus entomophilus]
MKKNKKNLMFYSLLFLSPIFLVILLFFILSITPFGTKTIWYIDLPAQLSFFYSHLQEVFKGQASILFSWNYGLGENFWATFTYYLSSPFSILIALFPKNLVPLGIIFIWLLKLGTSAVTMCLFLKSKVTKNPFILYITSFYYSLIGFSLTYFFLPMWIDAVYLLPLIILGVDRIIYQKKEKLFLFSLTLLFIANFYTGYMVGIFTFLYFIAELFNSYQRKKEILHDCFLFFKNTILAFIFTLFITVPTYMVLKESNFSSPLQTFHNFIGLRDTYIKMFNGYSDLQSLSLYSGVLILLLTPLFFLIKEIPTRQKVSYFFVGLILFSSIRNGLLNYIWHAFEQPNGASWRYVFVFSFFCLFLSSIALSHLLKSKNKNYFIYLFIIFCLNVAFLYFNTDLTFFTRKELLNIGLLTLFFLALLLLLKKYQSKKVLFCLIALTFIDISFNSVQILKKYSDISLSDAYFENIGHNYYAHALNKLVVSDKTFYRINTEPGIKNANDSLKYEYKGMAAYTSTINLNNNSSLSSFGFTTGMREFSAESGFTPFNCFLSQKYFLSQQTLSPYMYKLVDEHGPLKTYLNKFYIPFGYMVNRNFLNETLPNQQSVFENQNKLAEIASSSPLFGICQEVSSSSYNLKESKDPNGNVYLLKKNKQQKASIEYTVKVDELSQVYLSFGTSTMHPNIQIKLPDSNNAYLTSNNTWDLGTYAGQEVKIIVELTDSETLYATPIFYKLNLNSMNKLVTKIKKDTLSNLKQTNTSISGEINVHSKDDQVLFLSIPYDKNWTARVDNNKVKILKQGMFMGIPLTKGKHQISVTYVPKMFYICLFISISSLLFYLSVNTFRTRKNRKHSY